MERRRRGSRRRWPARGGHASRSGSMIPSEGDETPRSHGTTRRGGSQELPAVERSGRQRQEGRGRGDTVRLLARGILRGVYSRCGESAEADQGGAQAPPGGRSRGNVADLRPVVRCNKLTACSRRKPSGWWETTRAERDRRLGNRRPKLVLRDWREWTRARRCRWGGDANPKRGGHREVASLGGDTL